MPRWLIGLAFGSLAFWVGLAGMVDPVTGRRGISTASANAPTPVIIVVDFQAVIRDSAAAEQIQRQIAELRRGYQEEFGAVEDSLRASEAQLTEQRTTLPPEEFVRRRREFEEQVTNAQRDVQARRTALDQAFNQAMDTVRSTLLEVIADIARQQGANLVLSKGQVVLVDHSLEFSDQALAELNRRLPSVAVVAPGR